MNINNKYSIFKKINWNLILIIASLSIIGLINLYSATNAIHRENITGLFWKQIIWLCLGSILYIFTTAFNYNLLKKIAPTLFGLNLIALILTPFIGKTSYGATRWLNFGLFQWQPSESIKIFLIILIAYYLSYKRSTSSLSFKDLVFPLIILLVPFALIAYQPDLGTALLTVFTPCILLLVYKVDKKIVISGLLLLAALIPVTWKYVLKDYQKQRVLTFLSISEDTRGTGYNSRQSKITIGSGQFFGKGFLKGSQTQLKFIPERHSDFIFSVLNEEHGFIGGFITIILFALLLLSGYQITLNATDKFSFFLSLGLTMFLGVHILINVFMVTGLCPVVGVALPIMSYGGSNLVTNMFALGVLSSISYRQKIF